MKNSGISKKKKKIKKLKNKSKIKTCLLKDIFKRLRYES